MSRFLLSALVPLALGAACGSEDARSRGAGEDTGGVLFPDAFIPTDLGDDATPTTDVPTDTADTSADTNVAAPDTQADTTAQDTAPLADTDAAAPDTLTDTTAQDTGRPTDTGSDSTATICSEEKLTVSVAVEPPTILLVIDRSGSMYDKWSETVAAVGALVAQVGETVRLGLTLYPEDTGCSIADAPQVAPGPGQGALIVPAMQGAGTGGSTPMGRAMKRVRDYLDANRPAGEVAIVLAADGKPSDTCLEDCTGCDCTDEATCLWCADLLACTRREVSKHVDALRQDGIRTWVIGFEGGFGATDFLEELAVAGGTASEGPTPFFDAADGSALGGILSNIAGTVATCSAEVSEPAGYGYPVVTIDGTTVPRDGTHQDGWDWVDAGTLRLYGAACDAASEPGAALSISFICKGG